MSSVTEIWRFQSYVNVFQSCRHQLYSNNCQTVDGRILILFSVHLIFITEMYFLFMVPKDFEVNGFVAVYMAVN